MFYILATLADGRKVVCEFTQPQGMRRFAREVMSGARALPIWTVIGDAHPHSGEPMLVRTRGFISGTDVRELQAVEPRAGHAETHGYNPEMFGPQRLYKLTSGERMYGLWTAPAEGGPEGSTAGASYPVKRDAASQRRFVTLQAAGDVTQEVRHYLDSERAGSGSVDADGDDWDDVHSQDDDDDI